jgi:hypothetical protein
MVCVVSGRPADVRLGMRVRPRHGAPAVGGLLPFASESQRRLRLLVRTRRTILVGGFTLIAVLCAVGQWTAAVSAGIPLAVVAFVLNVVGAARSPDARADPSGRFVRLTGVHPNFVAAVTASGAPPSA